ncbi:MAG TPA: UDP-N-acetylmuramoyl-tripeptide--D-alanyl-D-alanine ligase [Candidatus Acidoferrales bacterium]|nr:UDP-N-acetylmuramoyl-tripeptide--D-alanyl-D-alanine ligase [Candidatus Acidoferrales bacterium]
MRDVHEIPGAEFHNVNFKSARSVSTDSRTLSAGEIFFAIRGDKFDGHNFVRDAVVKGTACAVVDRRWYETSHQLSALDRGPLVVVEDTTRALGNLARIYRRKFSMPVIAIGGSNGKTTTKEMAAAVLEKKFRVAKTSGNHNNQIGVPSTIFGFKKYHDAAVVEIGTNHFGEIKRLCEILEPNAGLITNIGAEHLEFFKDLSGVRKEEEGLFDFLTVSDGTAFINVDDRNITGMSRLPKHRFGFGFQSGTAKRRNLSGRLFGIDRRGCALFEIRYSGRTELVRLRIPGIHNAMNALAAAAIGCKYGISLSNIKSALENYRAFEKRMQLIETRGVRILNDTYNSNPESALSAIRWLSMIRAKGKKVAVLADMLELGESALQEHRKIGNEIAEINFDYLLTYGNLAKEISAAADSHEYHGTAGKMKIEAFDDKEKLSRRLLDIISVGDIVLIKGSRGMKMEEVVSALTNRLPNRGFR